MKSNTKDWLQYSSAVAMIGSGIVLAFLSFFLTDGHTITDGVLWYVGQSLAFAGAVFGISLYVKTKVGEISTEAMEDVKEMVRRWARGQDDETRQRIRKEVDHETEADTEV